MKQNSAPWMLASSMAIWGTLGIFVRNISVSTGELALYRSLFALLVIGCFMMFTKQTISLSQIKKQLPLLLLSGIAMGINWVLLFEAYQYTSISIATLSYYFAPVLVTLLCPLLFHEKLSAKQWICFMMSTLGLILILNIDVAGESKNDLIGILFGLGAAVFYASVVLFNKAIRDITGIVRTFWQFIAAALVLFPYVMLSGGISIAALDSTGWICLCVVGIVHTGFAYCLYFSSLKEISGQKAAIFSYIDPLLAVLVSFVILHESMTLLQLIGGALILGFTLWNELGSTKA